MEAFLIDSTDDDEEDDDDEDDDDEDSIRILIATNQRLSRQ